MIIWDDKIALEQAIKASSSLTEVIQVLGFNPKGSITRRKLNEAIQRFSIDTDHFGKNGKPKIDWTDDATLRTIVAKSTSLADVLRRLGLYKCSGNYTTLHKYLVTYEIDTSHFTEHRSPTNKIPLGEIIQGLHPSYKTYLLKQRLIDAGLLEHRCSECGIVEYNGKPISLELDHINGVSDDHRLLNLRILCPNCHSQTDTYKGKRRN